MNKAILFTTFLAIFMSGCSNEKKAQKTIEKYLSERLHDWNSYESVSLGKVDSFIQEVPTDPMYRISMSKFKAYTEMASKNIDEYESYEGLSSRYYFGKRESLLAEAKSMLDSSKYYQAKADSFLTNHKPYFNGWKVDHTYRANNATGNKVIGHYRFYLDPELKEIVDVIDLSE